jgi:hypothetical protein
MRRPLDRPSSASFINSIVLGSSAQQKNSKVVIAVEFVSNPPQRDGVYQLVGHEDPADLELPRELHLLYGRERDTPRSGIDLPRRGRTPQPIQRYRGHAATLTCAQPRVATVSQSPN